MRILTLSGWGQPHDALAAIAPDATHVDYAQYPAIEEALAHIAEVAQGHDAVIGWSLGGQLAARAIGIGMSRPRKLTLIATPFKLVHDGKNGSMGRGTHEKFRDNYAANPDRTLRKAYELIAHGDSRAAEVRGYLSRHDRQSVLSNDWLSWFDRLKDLSAENLDFSLFPPTLLVHGENDAVAGAAQAERFAAALPKATLALWKGCGHAPHWHDPAALAALIKEHHV